MDSQQERRRDIGQSEGITTSRYTGCDTVVKSLVIHTLVTRNLCDGQYELANALLEAGADPNELNGEGQTPIMTMCLNCEMQAVKPFIMRNRTQDNEVRVVFQH